MIELSVIRDLVAIFGVIAGFSYYVLTVKANQRNQQLQLETRQTQLFMQMYQQVNSENWWETWAMLMNLEVTDYDDFLEKFDHNVNPKNFGKRSYVWFSYNVLGNLLYDGKLEVHEINRLAGITSILQWDKLKDVILELREKQNISNYMKGFEYMVGELKKYREQHPDPYI